MKKNTMECWNCEKEFEFENNDIVEFIESEVNEPMIDPKVICPYCKINQIADYDY